MAAKNITKEIIVEKNIGPGKKTEGIYNKMLGYQ